MNQPLLPSFKLSRLPRVAILAASWHKDIVGVAVSAIRHEFDRCRIPPEQVSVIEVPSAWRAAAALMPSLPAASSWTAASTDMTSSARPSSRR